MTKGQLETFFQILTNHERRKILIQLTDCCLTDEPKVLIPEDVSDNRVQLEVVHQRLVHIHIPKLEDAELVQWNEKEQVIERGPQFSEIQILLELLISHEDQIPGKLA